MNSDSPKHRAKASLSAAGGSTRAMQRALVQPRRRRRRGAVAAVVGLSIALGVFCTWAVLRWERAASRPAVELDGELLGSEASGEGARVAGAPPSWRTGYLIIPPLVPAAGPLSPEEQIEAKLRAFASRVEATRRQVSPPLQAFGAEALRAELEGIIASIDHRALVSAHVRDLASARVLFDYYGDRPLNPASNHKVLTAAAALDLLGADFKFETQVLRVGADLYLVGGGDPTLDGEALRALATEVSERVVVGELESIVVDDSAFSEDFLGPGYASGGDGVSYKAPSGALSVNFNTVEITVYPAAGSRAPMVSLEPKSTHAYVYNRSRYGGGTPEVATASMFWPKEGPRENAYTRVAVGGRVSRESRGYRFRRRVGDPGMFAGGAFAEALADASQSEPLPVHIGIAPSVEELAWTLEEDGHGEFPRLVQRDPAELRASGGDERDEGDVELVALRRSPPLAEVVRGLLTYSNNFTAEQLLRTLGWKVTGYPGDWVNGGAVLRGYWEALGNEPEALVFENGSGLSERGRVSAAGLVEVLAAAYGGDGSAAALFEALPVAGTSGTLGGRLRRSGQRVRAKTGTLDGVSGLTGVITSEAGEAQVAFSILINVRDSDRMGAALRREIEDAIVMAVLGRIDGWEATRGTWLGDLEPLDVRARGGE